MLVRFQPDQLAQLDDWITDQPLLPALGRPEAIRRLVEIGLKSASKISVLR